MGSLSERQVTDDGLHASNESNACVYCITSEHLSTAHMSDTDNSAANEVPEEVVVEQLALEDAEANADGTDNDDAPWHQGKSLSEQMLAGWYAKHTHRASLKPDDPWLTCKLISPAHPLYGRSKDSHENVSHDDGINHICLKRGANDALCFQEFKLQVKKQRGEVTAKAPWARGASFHSSLLATH